MFMGFYFSSFKSKGFNTIDSELAEQPALPLEQSCGCNASASEKAELCLSSLSIGFFLDFEDGSGMFL